MLAAIEGTTAFSSPPQLDDPWRVMRVMTGRETEVDFQLRRQDIPSTVLMWKVSRTPHGADRPQLVDRPIFPGYVLLRCLDEERGPILRSFPFLIEFLRFGSRLAMVQQDELDRVNQMLVSGVIVQARPHLTRGQKVRIKYGPLMDVVGEFVKEKNETIFVVNLQMFGRSVATRMSWDQVEAIKEEPPAATSKSSARKDNASNRS